MLIESAAVQAHESVPVVEHSGGVVQVFAGSAASVTFPAGHFSSLVGADLLIHGGQRVELAVGAAAKRARSGPVRAAKSVQLSGCCSDSGCIISTWIFSPQWLRCS